MNEQSELRHHQDWAIGHLLEGFRGLESELNSHADRLLPPADLTIVAHPGFLSWPDAAHIYASYCVLHPVEWEMFSPAGLGAAPVVVPVVADSFDDLDRELRALEEKAAALLLRMEVPKGEQLVWHLRRQSQR